MNMAARVNKSDTDADIAVRLLRDRRTAMHYRELVVAIRVLRGLSSDPTPAEVAASLTQINIDSRFIHLGKGVWGLRDWNPPAPKPEVEKPRALRSRNVDIEDFLLDDDDEIVEDELDDEDIDDPDDVEATEEVIDEVEEVLVDEDDETEFEEIEVLEEEDEEDEDERP